MFGVWCGPGYFTAMAAEELRPQVVREMARVLRQGGHGSGDLCAGVVVEVARRHHHLEVRSRVSSTS
jgi:hypothetical protein